MRTAFMPEALCGFVQLRSTEVLSEFKVATTSLEVTGGIYWRADGADTRPSISAPGIAALAPALYIGITVNS